MSDKNEAKGTCDVMKIMKMKNMSRTMKVHKNKL